jgi:hypothetical protein
MTTTIFRYCLLHLASGDKSGFVAKVDIVENSSDAEGALVCYGVAPLAEDMTMLTLYDMLGSSSL